MRTHQRILTIQRQARELGRMRTGTFNGKYPERSKTWILTSQAEHYVMAAAAEWGGTVEKYQPQGSGAAGFRVITKASAIDAILPPGDPLSQSFEVWSKGGCQRRCDGITETLADSPCYCLAKWGDNFHEVKPKPKAPVEDTPCKMTTRVNLVLPSLPDLGVWRVETHSYWAANEIAASIDMIRAAVGPAELVPVTVRIEQRTSVARGETKHFPVIAVELRGATAGQILAATMARGVGGREAAGELAGGRTAIEAARPDYVAMAVDAKTLDEVREVWKLAADNAHLDKILGDRLKTIGDLLKSDGDAEEEVFEVVEAENESDYLWGLIVDNAPEGWSTSQLNKEFAARNNGELPVSAGVGALTAFLVWLQNVATP